MYKDLNKKFNFFCSIFDLFFKVIGESNDFKRYKVFYGTEEVIISIGHTIEISGDDSWLKNILRIWANDDKIMKRRSGSSGFIIFSLEWGEWKEDSDNLQNFILKYGIPNNDRIPDDYRCFRDRMFHDFMFRNKMFSEINYLKAIDFITSWIDKNCFMNINEKELFEKLEKYLSQYKINQSGNINIECLASGLSFSMSDICSKKYFDEKKQNICPQTKQNHHICVCNLVDDIYPYTNGNEVVAFNKTNLNNLISIKRRNNITWKSLAPSTPIEKIMEKALKDGNFSLIPQYQAYNSQHKYVIDFLINTNTNIKMAIECDGLEYHANKSQYIHDRKRDRYLTRKGILLLRFSSVEIFNEIDRCISEIDEQYWLIKSERITDKPRRLSYFGIDD